MRYEAIYRWYFADPHGKRVLSDEWLTEVEARKQGALESAESTRRVRRVPENEYEATALKRMGDQDM